MNMEIGTVAMQFLFWYWFFAVQKYSTLFPEEEFLFKKKILKTSGELSHGKLKE